MTEKRTKDSIMIVFMTLLTGMALLYGFTTIPNPSKQRIIRLDQQRVTDLGQLHYSIDDYYRLNQRLPEWLSSVRSNSYTPLQPLTTTDPESGKAYEYKVTSPIAYQLCATFTTDAAAEKAVPDENNYQYASFKNTFLHGIGKTCFDFTVSPPDQAPVTNIWPSYAPPPKGGRVPMKEKPNSAPEQAQDTPMTK